MPTSYVDLIGETIWPKAGWFFGVNPGLLRLERLKDGSEDTIFRFEVALE